MFNNRFVEYLWNKDRKTRIEVFGSLGAAGFFGFFGFPGLSALVMVGFLGFILLEAQSLQATYLLHLMEENGLDTEKIKNMEQVYRLAEDN